MPRIQQFHIPEEGDGGEMTLGVLLEMLDSIVNDEMIQTAEDYYSHKNYLAAAEKARAQIETLNELYRDGQTGEYYRKLLFMVNALNAEVVRKLERATKDNGLYENVREEARKKYGKPGNQANGPAGERGADIVAAYVASHIPAHLDFLLERTRVMACVGPKIVRVMPPWLKECLESLDGGSLYYWRSEKDADRDVPYMETALTLWEPSVTNGNFYRYDEALRAARIL